MKIVGCIVVLGLAGALGCEKRSAPPPAPPAAESVAADGTRVIPVAVNDEGFVPAAIRAAPGARIELRFTRQTKSECGAQVKVGAGELVDLPVGQAVAVAVQVPASGELAFTCGMDMLRGVIQVN